MSRPFGPLEPRFFAKVSPEPNSGCWLWTGAIDGKAYGQIRVAGRNRPAHIVSLEIAGRSSPYLGAIVRHKCDVPLCVNPEHLQWGSLKDNTADMVSRGRNDFSGLRVGHELMRAKRSARPNRNCEECGSTFKPRAAQERSNKHFFCSVPCTVAWQKAKYTGRPITSCSEQAV